MNRVVIARALLQAARELVGEDSMASKDAKKLAMGLGNAVARKVKARGRMKVRRIRDNIYRVRWNWLLGDDEIELWLRVWVESAEGPVVIDYGYTHGAEKDKKQTSYWANEGLGQAVKDLSRSIGQWLDPIRAEAHTQPLKVARELLLVARMMSADLEILFVAEDDSMYALRGLNEAFRDMSEAVAKITESDEYQIGSRDEGRSIEMFIAVPDSKQKRHQLSDIKSAARKIGRKYKLRVWA
jgi:hypothetical protein